VIRWVAISAWALTETTRREDGILPSSRYGEFIDLLSQLLFLGRFLCFMAIFYLALHKIVLRLTQKPNSKLLWFFSVITGPLTRPVRAWMHSRSEDQLLSKALVFYGFLWLCFVLIANVARAP
jgi:hypothetical protein